MPRPARLLLAGLAAALVATQATAAPRRDPSQPYRSLDVLAEVLAYIQNGYVDETSEKELVQAAVEGMVSRLDPHSMILRPEAYRSMRDETTGEFDGVGIEVVQVADGLVVVAPLPDSPAERAGVLAGDRIVAVDGTPTKEMGLGEATRRMKGIAGTTVALTIERTGQREPRVFTLVRDHVRTTSVDWRVLDPRAGTVYVRIRTFQDRTDRELRQALDGARKSLGGEIQGLVLDLRNNPGGLLDQAVKVADRFLSGGVIVSTESRGKKPEVEEAHEKDTEAAYPIVLLVNRGSASASEIVAGALQDHARAVVVGTQTFGKGSVQTVVELEDGSALKLTVARYYTPKHRSIQERGITPDVPVAESPPPDGEPPGPAESDLRRHLVNEQPAVSPAAAGTPQTGRGGEERKGDPQLDRAVDLLRAARVFRGGAGAPP
ncbi:MAG TPA: S41 family peptidase [Anaeromyxobacteraceae bacterium]|nr:S41 family peptidase [Anaeromyxobacteraceae bacterium]